MGGTVNFTNRDASGFAPFPVQNGVHDGIEPDGISCTVQTEIQMFDQPSLAPHTEPHHQLLGGLIFGIAHGDDTVGKSCPEGTVNDSRGGFHCIAPFPVRAVKHPADFP